MKDEIKGGIIIRKLVAKLVKKALKKTYGVDMNVTLDGFHMYVDENDMAHIAINASAETKSDAIKKLVDEI